MQRGSSNWLFLLLNFYLQNRRKPSGFKSDYWKDKKELSRIAISNFFITILILVIHINIFPEPLIWTSRISSHWPQTMFTRLLFLKYYFIVSAQCLHFFFKYTNCRPYKTKMFIQISKVFCNLAQCYYPVVLWTILKIFVLCSNWFVHCPSKPICTRTSLQLLLSLVIYLEYPPYLDWVKPYSSF